MKKFISEIIIGALAVNLLAPCVFGESNVLNNDDLYTEESVFEEYLDSEISNEDYCEADGFVLADNDGAPALLSGGDNVIARFGSSYLDTSAPMSKDFSSDITSPVTSAKVAVCKSGSALGTCGIRNNVPFVLNEENSYVSVTYYVKAVTADEGTNPRVSGLLQYCTANGSNGGNTVNAFAGIKNEQTLENDVWYKCFQIFKIDSTGYSASGKDFSALRFVLNAGQPGQTTYLGGFSVYNFGTEFEYLDAQNTENAIIEYIEQPKLSEISVGGKLPEGFDPNVNRYMIRTDDPDEEIVTSHSIFADVETETEDNQNGVRTVNLTVNTYKSDIINKYGSYANTNVYTVYMVQSDVLSADDFGIYSKDGEPRNGISKGENVIKMRLKNRSEAVDATLFFAVLNDESKACIDVKSVDVLLAKNAVSDEISENIEVLDDGKYSLKVFAVDRQSYKPLTGNLSGSDTLAEGGEYGKINAVVNYEKSVIEASGRLKGGMGQRFFAAVVGGKGGFSLNSVCFADLITASPDGTFLFEFVPCNADKYTYFTLYVFDEELNTYQTAGFDYFDESVIDKAAEWFETASENDVSDALSEKILINGNIKASVIFGGKLEQYTALINKSYVDKALAKTKFASVADLVSAFENAVADAKICDEFNLSDADNFDLLVVKYAEKLKIDLNENYAYKALGDDGKKAVFDKLCEKKNFSEPDEIGIAVNDAVILYLYNNSSWGDIAELCGYYKDILKIDLTDVKFVSLGETRQANVFKAMQSAVFTQKSDIASKFYAETQSQYSLMNSGSGKSSGGGGGTKGGTISVAPTVPSDEPKDDDNVKFTDVDESNWAKDYIYDLCKKGIINGFDDGTFKPDNELTRAEFVKMTVLAFGMYDGNAEVNFSDCANDDWYYPFVASAVRNGAVNGISESLFAPNEKITRQDMAVIIYRIINGRITVESDYDGINLNDFGKVTNYAKESVSEIFKAGIISGDENGNFAPMNFATRAEAAKVISVILSLNN